MEQLGEFFRALPDAVRALWGFGDPTGNGNGFVGLLITGGSVVLLAAFLGLAYRLRADYGWVSGLFGGMATLLALWWLMGILPSAWVYFVDSQRTLLEGRIIPGAITLGQLDVASNFYQVFRDSVVMLENTVVFIGLVVVGYAIQRRFPRGLGEGEERGPTSGGYK